MKKLLITFFVLLSLIACQSNLNDPLITFDTNGGEPINPIKLSELTELPTPKKDGYSFENWYLEANYIKKYTMDIVIETDTTLYAKFLKHEPKEIVIMHGSPSEADPFDLNYVKSDKLTRQQLQLEIEEKYNVKVIYKTYPREALWGEKRVDYIINKEKQGNSDVDIYSITSAWIKELATNNVVSPIDMYLNQYTNKPYDEYKDFFTFDNKQYGFNNEMIMVDEGLFYNIDLLNRLEIANPAQMYLDGNWKWSDFESWVKTAQEKLNLLGSDYFTLGGKTSLWAKEMIPLNGGKLVNDTQKTIDFDNKEAMETYNFLTKLYTEHNVFDINGGYVIESGIWDKGKVLMHPASLSSMHLNPTWLEDDKHIGFVPYPINDTFTGEYISTKSTVNSYVLSNSKSKEKQELAFRVWNEIQIWESTLDIKNSVEEMMKYLFKDELSAECYLTIFNKVKLENMNNLFNTFYQNNGWLEVIRLGIENKNINEVIIELKVMYEEYLKSYYNLKD